MFSLSLLLAVLLVSSAAADPAPRLFHRVHHPAIQPPLAFSERGSFRLANSIATLDHSETYADDFAEFAAVLEEYPDALYQIAMEREGDKDETHWDISSVRACHLPHTTAETFILHLSPYDHKPFSLDYFVSPIPHDGSCPKTKASTGFEPSVAFRPFANGTVLLREPISPPSPELRTPPPLTPQGEPVKPPVEKSFVQKYWIYIVALLLALLIAPGGADEGGGGQARR
ncbi:hypothetical protein NEOLEDRAFT_1183517 [Neolentinus lepideus HHB14362 ss-1]|uniref:ER membrane protein complex subunit 10 n=1 Tax=Neolentinus lepideus HHB14362 ss-1 TaxID=1314782 RepID=A0A165N7F3_9AGAM|nr:hypothetical protein NEOLEDRAFT_1183517 [Neolentinus lepideus HHB14362 ss-1]